jgi:iron complex outermembrane recepter protein
LRLAFFIIAVILLLQPFIASGQSLDDTLVLKPTQVTGFFNKRPFLRLPASVSIADSAKLELLEGTSPVAILNQISGVRMEERSPGSYRLSIRGSLLRSPFGIRNVKVYIDEYPLTDAGGNTYLNLLDLSTFKRIEVLKGPDGSLYGANSGGVLKFGINSEIQDKLHAETNFLVGSYGMCKQNALIDLNAGSHELSFVQSTQNSSGYRENSSMKRNFFQVADRWDYNKNAQIQVLLFYSQLEYEIPGGLTFDQWQADPRAARPPTSFLPGTKEQNAGVRNNTIFGGITHNYQISRYVKHLVAVFGSLTDYENSFITNFEERDEKSIGIRTYLEATNDRPGQIHLTYNLGLEAQQSLASVANYGNRAGEKDTIQAADDLTAKQSFLFGRVSVDFYNKLILEASASINYNRYFYRNVAPVEGIQQENAFTPQIMPRITASYLIIPTLAWRATVSKGYSPPTFNEIRSSDNVINTRLEPEWGYNYETGFRLIDRNQRLWIDAAAFIYHLQEAIVRRTNEAGNEYFLNAGDILQPGFEAQFSYNIIKRSNQSSKKGSRLSVKVLQFSGSYTMHAFRFNNYLSDTNNYSGNQLTGVPGHQVVTGIFTETSGGLFGYLNYTFTSKIPLNDANSVYADPGNHLYFKAGMQVKTKLLTFRIFAGIDNVLNARYSLGNDINAFGGRYYNPAPVRNYYAGLNVAIK